MKKFLIIALVATLFCSCEKINRGKDPYLKLSKELITFDSDGGKESIKVSSNCEWIITGGDNWCTPSIDKGNGNMSIIFTVAKNDAIRDLKTTFYFEFEGEFGTEIVELEVVQETLQVDNVATLMDDAVFIAYCYRNFDLNQDGKISMMEANTVKVIEIKSEKKLKSVKGISLFTNLEDISFKGTGLQCIDLSKNTKLTAIREEAFYGCGSLTSITIPDSVTSIGNYAFQYCISLESITIPNCVTSIGDSTFSGCSSLTSVTIPDSVTSIEEYAFKNCSSLNSVIIGNGVIFIGYYAFYGCTSLKSVFCMPTTPPAISLYSFEWNAFDRNASGRRINVPDTSVHQYKVADGWKKYSSDIY